MMSSKRSGPHVGERPAHALPFHLEDADRLAAREHCVRFGIVERNAQKIEINATSGDEVYRRLQNSERRQAEEVEFHQPRLLDPLHVELGDRQLRFRIAIHRDQFGERPVADHDAGRMRRGVAVQAFELHRDVEGALDHRLGVARGLQARLFGNRFGERHGSGRVVRHQLGELVDLPVRHFEHAPDIAQHAACLQRAEGDDLRDLVAAVALLHVVDHLVAPLLAEIDVEVRHRHALRIEEALEQEAEADRIEVGDGERVGDERACARTAARPHRNAFRLRPLDEVGDDQEVARILHLLDHRELEIEPLAVVVDGLSRGETERLDAAGEALVGLAAQFGILVDRAAVQPR